MEPTLGWALACFALALALFVVEVLLPSGGLLGIAALGAAGIGIGLLFAVNPTLGFAGLGATVAATPVLLFVAVKVFPHTPLARLLTLRNPEPARRGAGGTAETGRRRLEGCVGRARTDLRPSGACDIEGERLDCVAEHGVIPRGTPVEVVRASGMEIRVRPVSLEALTDEGTR
jgi:membrane-bound serine protease (ClpP class)